MAEREASSVTPRLRRMLAGVVVLLIAMSPFALTTLSDPPAARAVAEGLPTWDDVEAAKANEAAAAAKVTEIQALIAEVQRQVEVTRQASDIAATKLLEAEAELRVVEERLAMLEEQAAVSAAEADAAAEQAAALVSQMYRSGGVDRNMSLFLEADDETADALLDRLARMEKATERNTTISEQAEQKMNSARSLSEQTESARAERDRLRAEAEVNRIAAAEAADAARSELLQQEANQQTLEAQLAALMDTTVSTVEGYEERLRLEQEERERLAREAAEAARRAAEEAARRAAEEAARRAEEAAAGGGGGGGGAPQPAEDDWVGTGGWVRPLICCYGVTAEFWGYDGHMGIDLAIGAWTPIYAASGGTVSYSGWAAGYGNVVFLNHGSGVQTRYAHMVVTPIVGYGQWVEAGQMIGYVGNTGYSFGDHLHFETLVAGSNANPRSFMAARGVYF